MPPDVGKVTTEAGAVVSIVQVKLAGDASVLPAASVARTWKVCEPWLSPVWLLGELQADQPPPSSWHSKVEPPSEELKEKSGAAELLGSLGCAVIVVFGAAVSIVHVYVAGVGS